MSVPTQLGTRMRLHWNAVPFSYMHADARVIFLVIFAPCDRFLSIEPAFSGPKSDSAQLDLVLKTQQKYQCL